MCLKLKILFVTKIMLTLHGESFPFSSLSLGIAPMVQSARAAIQQPANEVALAQFSQKADKVFNF